MSQYFSRIFELLFLPPGIFIFLLLLSLVFIHEPALLKRVLWLQLILMLTLSIPVTGHFLFKYLETIPPLTEQQIKDNKADVIVVLAGGIIAYQQEYAGADINYFTLIRLRYGAWLQKKTGLPIIVTGGVEQGGITEAELMARVLHNEYGITEDKIFIEKQSHNTYENALYSSQIMDQEKFQNFYLVTSAFHQSRAILSFTPYKQTIIPAPMGYYHNTMDYLWGDFMPSSNAMRGNFLALHEIVGHYWYLLRNRYGNISGTKV